MLENQDGQPAADVAPPEWTLIVERWFKRGPDRAGAGSMTSARSIELKRRRDSTFASTPWIRHPHAFAELLDRALDKPRCQEQEVTVSGEVDVVARLAAARRAKPVVQT